MTRTRGPVHDPAASYGINRGQLALQLIQLGDNMRLRADLGQPTSLGQIQAYNQAADQWDQLRIPHQRGKEQAK